MYHEDLVKILPKLLNKRGIINIGGKTQSIYQFVKADNSKIKKSKLKRNAKLPLLQSMNLSRLKKII